MTPLTNFSSAPPQQGSNLVDYLQRLRSRVSSASLSLHQSLDEMMGVLDSQVKDLIALKEQLRATEANLRAQAPQVAALSHLPPLPVIQQPSPMMPQSTPQVSPFSYQPPAPAAQPIIQQPPLQMAPPPAPLPEPIAPKVSGPMMTQILWPSKTNTDATTKAATITSPTAPIQTAPPVPPPASVPMMVSAPPAPPPVAPAMPVQIAPPSVPIQPLRAPASAPAAATGPVSTGPMPALEQATLEELNAALAYAFSQVSSSKPAGSGGVTQMMPPPMPTNALRYGQVPDAIGR